MWKSLTNSINIDSNRKSYALFNAVFNEVKRGELKQQDTVFYLHLKQLSTNSA